jgi:hypothetical protein
VSLGASGGELVVGLRAMRCLLCNAEMILIEVVEDDTMLVPGFEHHTLMCSECHDVERRFVFTKHSRESKPAPVQAASPIACEQSNNEPIPLNMAPSIAPSSTVQDKRVVTPGLFRRVIAKVRGR